MGLYPSWLPRINVSSSLSHPSFPIKPLLLLPSTTLPLILKVLIWTSELNKDLKTSQHELLIMFSTCYMTNLPFVCSWKKWAGIYSRTHLHMQGSVSLPPYFWRGYCQNNFISLYLLLEKTQTLQRQNSPSQAKTGDTNCNWDLAKPVSAEFFTFLWQSLFVYLLNKTQGWKPKLWFLCFIQLPPLLHKNLSMGLENPHWKLLFGGYL